MNEAVILDIQRMSTEDGPGLRTTVFFKGCNLKCAWCHNPESINFKRELHWYKNRCIGCKICVAKCKKQGIKMGNDGITFTRDICIDCGTCMKECPAGAIELKGVKYTVENLAKELLKDKAYWGKDGGVTLSGGEVMMQPVAATELCKLLKAAGVAVAIDTAGAYDYARLQNILPYADMVLYDLKIFNSDLHKKFTAIDNALILENYKKLIADGVRVWVRTPIIPGATDSVENIEAIASFIASVGEPEKWELCTFNNLCKDKYTRLDKVWDFADTQRIKKSFIEDLTARAHAKVSVACWSGVTVE
ncbi:MAG: glycyl-radical enzyme activating protein [Christensenellaceae bacterium]|jgi:pyruvate formate lyase activating enzyme|nr:glycyl-radical enzyme activating protein [Christensenellaceae bacterium]